MRQFQRWGDRAVESCAAIALFLMMVLTLVDVIGRKFFSRPLTGTVELTELMMVVVLFFALPLVSARNQHIVFDLFDSWLSPAARRVQQALVHLLAASLFGAAAWVVAVRGMRTVEFGDVTAHLRIPTGPFQITIAVLLVVSAIVHLALAFIPAEPTAHRTSS